MSDKPITIVISDLHVGAADKADDHIYKNKELERFSQGRNTGSQPGQSRTLH